jgi:hypothetical protein
MLLCLPVYAAEANADGEDPASSAPAYRLVVMQPDITVSLITAGGQVEPREDWTALARENIYAALLAEQDRRGGRATITTTPEQAGADPDLVNQLDLLHEAVGQSIILGRYTPGHELPTKQLTPYWTLGQLAAEYGRASGYDYALFMLVRDSFVTSGRMALQVAGVLGCAVGVCVLPGGPQQIAFASLVDLRTGRVVWFNYHKAMVGDVRTREGAQDLIDKLLLGMTPAAVLPPGQ